MKGIMFFLIVFLFFGVCQAQVDDATAIKILIGEGSNQGLEGMTAIGEVVRRRNPSAFSCLKNPSLDAFIARQGVRVHSQAVLAWERSATSNLTLNATHYEAVSTFGLPYWAKTMQKTVKIGAHTFYK